MVGRMQTTIMFIALFVLAGAVSAAQAQTLADMAIAEGAGAKTETSSLPSAPALAEKAAALVAGAKAMGSNETAKTDVAPPAPALAAGDMRAAFKTSLLFSPLEVASIQGAMRGTPVSSATTSLENAPPAAILPCAAWRVSLTLFLKSTKSRLYTPPVFL